MVIPTQLLANNKKICFNNESTIKTLTTDLIYCKTNIPILKKDIELCNNQLSIKEQEKSILLTQTEALLKDKEDLKKATEIYKNDLINKNDKLNKCEESKPSRFVWFGVGSVVTTIVGIVMLFLIKK